jgi:hypothetical protein
LSIEVPQVDRVLFGDTLTYTPWQAWSSQDWVLGTSMVGVVDECRENTSELRQGSDDTVRVIMKCRAMSLPSPLQCQERANKELDDRLTT